jgi:membrane protein DedA with SNARE-associated domain
MEHTGIFFEYLEPFVREYGVAAVAVILTFESFGAPLPGESLLIFAAVLAARGDIPLGPLLVSAWAAAVVGDNIGYVIGRMFGRALLVRYGARIGLTAERLDKVEAVFRRYGPITVAFARFFNVLRQLNGVVAGVLAMDWRQFLLFNALGGALWVCTWVLGVYYFATHVSDIATAAHRLGLAGVVVAAAALIAGLAYLFLRPGGVSRPDRSER